MVTMVGIDWRWFRQGNGDDDADTGLDKEVGCEYEECPGVRHVHVASRRHSAIQPLVVDEGALKEVGIARMLEVDRMVVAGVVVVAGGGEGCMKWGRGL